MLRVVVGAAIGLPPAAQQSHRAGPAWFGRLGLGEHEALQMQAAYLLGTVCRRHGSMFSLRVQCSF